MAALETGEVTTLFSDRGPLDPRPLISFSSDRVSFGS